MLQVVIYENIHLPFQHWMKTNRKLVYAIVTPAFPRNRKEAVSHCFNLPFIRLSVKNWNQ